MNKPTEIMTSCVDLHQHPRNGDMMKILVPHITKYAWGAVAMPNTTPRLTTWKIAAEYLEELRSHSPSDFKWIGTCYLTDNTDPDDLEEGYRKDIWRAAKYYPAGMTTNSAEAVTDIRKIKPVLERARNIGMPILVHGETAGKEIHPELAESLFMVRTLPQLADSGATLIIEHVSDGATAELVARRHYKNIVGATLTPQHLAFDSSAFLQTTRFEQGFKRGARPKFVCMPPLKMPGHNTQIMDAIKSAPELFGAGTDSAAHPVAAKYQDCGACGCITSRPIALYATAFDEAHALDLLPDFLGVNLLQWYGLEPRKPNLKLISGQWPDEEWIGKGEYDVESITWGMTLPWKCVKMNE